MPAASSGDVIIGLVALLVGLALLVAERRLPMQYDKVLWISVGLVSLALLSLAWGMILTFLLKLLE